MSLLSSIILPKLEKELVALEPEIAALVLSQLKSIGSDLLTWVEQKLEEPKADASSDVAK